jgi:hypothetical protein
MHSFRIACSLARIWSVAVCRSTWNFDVHGHFWPARIAGQWGVSLCNGRLSGRGGASGYGTTSPRANRCRQPTPTSDGRALADSGASHKARHAMAVDNAGHGLAGQMPPTGGEARRCAWSLLAGENCRPMGSVTLQRRAVRTGRGEWLRWLGGRRGWASGYLLWILTPGREMEHLPGRKVMMALPLAYRRPTHGQADNERRETSKPGVRYGPTNSPCQEPAFFNGS